MMASLTCIVTQSRRRPHGRGHAMTASTYFVAPCRPHSVAEGQAKVASSRSRIQITTDAPLASMATQIHPSKPKKVTIMPKPASNQANRHGHALIPSVRLERPPVTRQVNEAIAWPA